MSFEQQDFRGEYQGSAESHYIDTPEQVELRFSVAGIGSRFVAVLLDHLIQLVALLGEFLIFYWISTYAPKGAGDSSLDTAGKWFLGIVIFLNFAFFVGYFSLFEAYWKGKTPGKHVMKLRVIKDSGRQITFFEALARNLIRFPELFVPGLYLTGVIAMLCNKSNKRLGDFAAGTIVVHERLDEQPLLMQPSGFQANSIFQAASPEPAALDLRRVNPLLVDRSEPSQPAGTLLFPADAVAKLTAQDLALIEAFFARALDLTVELRAAMAAKLARQMSAKMGVPLPEGNPERALEAIAYTIRGSGGSRW